MEIVNQNQHCLPTRMTDNTLSAMRLVKGQRGLGMIEVLVTLFILSVGLLGVASLQFMGSFSNADALNRSQSVMIAQQFSERLRANAVMSQVSDGMIIDNNYFDANLYNFDNLSCAGGGQPYACYCMAHPATVPDCLDNTCSAAEIAAYDAYQVSCSAAASNPATQISLGCQDNNNADAIACSPGSKHIIMLRWPVQKWQNVNRTANADCNQNTSINHDCVILEVTL